MGKRSRSDKLEEHERCREVLKSSAIYNRRGMSSSVSTCTGVSSRTKTISLSIDGRTCDKLLCSSGEKFSRKTPRDSGEQRNPSRVASSGTEQNTFVVSGIFTAENRAVLPDVETCSSEVGDSFMASRELPFDKEECYSCKLYIPSSVSITCSHKDCSKSYHYSCITKLRDCSLRKNGALICPQHACHACGRNRVGRLWKCEMCPTASHELCCPWPEDMIFFEDRPGWAICWRHTSDRGSALQVQHKWPTGDMKEVFRRLPTHHAFFEDFTISWEFQRRFSENSNEPPPYTHIRRNVFLIKKKRDDSDDGVGCTCGIDGSECGEDCECRAQSMSCSKDCVCNKACTNKPYRKEKRVKVVKTQSCGWGAEAAEIIRKGEFIIEYIGEVINDAMCEKRLWSMKDRGINNFYMCEIMKDFIIDATFKGNPSRFLNHSCLPNCKLEKWRVDGETRAGVFALRDIGVGEPLTYDYKYVEFGADVKCCCGAPNCRGAIGERLASRSVLHEVLKWGGRRRRSIGHAKTLCWKETRTQLLEM